ncbi:MAG: 1-acyl-sn-glycerol-3-phosphate acyltransferase [Clostridia bacterium]|nr:1-acyl-sn-glycerol-3-phosphate acyltransferase [Clostridia bacterium]
MWLGRFLLWLLGPAIRLLVRVKVVGYDNLPPVGEPLVLCSNHISNWDPVVLLVIQRKRPIHFMAKAELFKNRLFSWFIGKQFGAFAVHRGTGDTGAIDTAKRIVSEGKIMGIFPEGTRSRDGKLMRAKSDAALIVAQTGATVQPVAVVARNQRVRLFRRTLFVYGKPLTPAELHLDGDTPDIRFASRRLMEVIGDLIEQHRAEVEA